MKSEETTQGRRTTKEGLQRAISVVSIWGFTSALFSSLFMIPILEWVSLGPRFVPSILAASALALLAAAIVAAKYNHENPRKLDPSKWPFSRKATVMIVIAGLVVIAAIPFSGISQREFQEWRNANEAEEAKRRFAIIQSLGSGKEFGEEQVNQTLRELEDSFQTLKNNWALPQNASKITVWLLRDLESYQARTGKNHAAGHASCLDKHGPVVVIPLEKAPSSASDDSLSRVPMHEMVHAMMCQSLGEENFYSVPRWFLEGMAERYEMAGLNFARFFSRAEKKARLWLKRNRLMEPERFCALRLDARSIDEGRTFYETSREFVNSLESSHGMDALNRIVDDVGRGVSFENSMMIRLDGTCEEQYSQWRNSF